MEKKETEMVLTGKTTSWIASKQGEELVFPFGIMFEFELQCLMPGVIGMWYNQGKPGA